MALLKLLNTKKTIAMVVVAGLAAFSLSSNLVGAVGPQFNIFPISYSGGLNQDLPLLDARNVTQGGTYSTSQTDHDNGLSANPGDTIRFSIYYHNGAPDDPANTAINTIVQAFANPSLTGQALDHTISALVKADNATQASSLNHGGDMVVHIQGGVAQSLSLVPGTVTWFPNRAASQQTMPDTIFTTGTSLGNIRGCFEFSGFVNFDLKVSNAQPIGTLQIQKTVKNVTQGLTLSHQVNANPQDTVEYQILVTASANPVPNVYVKDLIDSKLSPIGNVTLDGVVTDNTSFFGSGLNIGTVNTSQARQLIFRAQVAGASSFGTQGTFTMPNTATAYTSTASVQDTANVVVTIVPVPVVCSFTYSPPLVSDGSLRGLRHVGDPANVMENVTGLQPNQTFSIVDQNTLGNPTLSGAFQADAYGNFSRNETLPVSSSFTPGDYNVFIQVNGSKVADCRGFRIELPPVQQITLTKSVKNETTASEFLKQVTASPAQRVMFKIILNPGNSNTAVTGVVLKETLPTKLTFVTGSLNVDGTQMSEGGLFTGTGLQISNISPNTPKTISFEADIKDATNFAVGCEDLVNSATVTATGNLTSTDTATVQVCKQAPSKAPGSPGVRPN